MLSLNEGMRLDAVRRNIRTTNILRKRSKKRRRSRKKNINKRRDLGDKNAGDRSINSLLLLELMQPNHDFHYNVNVNNMNATGFRF